jgi:hypothetical protein
MSDIMTTSAVNEIIGNAVMGATCHDHAAGSEIPATLPRHDSRGETGK